MNASCTDIWTKGHRGEPWDMTITKSREVQLFCEAVVLLKQIDPAFSLYVASDTLHLMHGSSHDEHTDPRHDNILASARGLRISGGNW